MLIRFNVENFLSFNKKVEFSLIANQERRLPTHFIKENGITILKSAVIYGANASGKSNLVKAIAFSQEMITKGAGKMDFINKHFRLDKSNVHRPSIFHYEIKAGGKFYAYGFAVQLNKNIIVEEWLYEIGANKEKMIFERYIENGKHQIKIGIQLTSTAKTRFKVYQQDFQTSDSILFLSEINRKNIDNFPEALDFNNVFDWFNRKLTVLFPESKYAGLNYIGNDENLSKVFNSFLNVFQTGIDKIVSEEINPELLDIPGEIKDELMEAIRKNNVLLFEINGISYALSKDVHNEYIIKKIGLEHLGKDGNKVIFDLENESDGTQRLFDFIPALRGAAISDLVLIIDELDRSLHSKLSRGIFELFFEIAKDNQSQLIATTHESLLLDLNLLRRDEIWFVEKAENESHLYSLDEFKVRNDKIVRKDYLLGRYGAIPIFKSFKNLNF